MFVPQGGIEPCPLTIWVSIIPLDYQGNITRDAVGTGPLVRDHLIWPPVHLFLDSTGPDWPPKSFCKNMQIK